VTSVKENEQKHYDCQNIIKMQEKKVSKRKTTNKISLK